MADLSTVVSSTKDSIGHYFGLVSALPSVLLVGWVVVLVGSGAWSDTPSLAKAVSAITGLGLGGTAGLLLASLALGVALHPMQFAFVQLLEGYWGVAPAARRARYLGMRRHRQRLLRLRQEAIELEERIELLEESAKTARGVELDHVENEMMGLVSIQDEIDRIVGDFPSTLERTMPTRLGNILRYYEDKAGVSYGLNAIIVLPYLSRVAAAGDMDYVNDQRSQLDLAVRMTIVSLIASALSVMFFARHGLWLLVALIPYFVGYLSYRGAIVAAAEYGRSLAVLISLNRFALYERLRLATPESSAVERQANETLMELLRNEGATRSVDYSDRYSRLAPDDSVQQ